MAFQPRSVSPPGFGTLLHSTKLVRGPSPPVQHNITDIFDKCIHTNVLRIYATESHGADTPGLRSYFLKSIVTLITFALNLIECCNLQLTERMNGLGENNTQKINNNMKNCRNIRLQKRGVMIVHYLP